MKFRIIVFFALFCSSALSQPKLVVGYYPSWNKSSFPHTLILYRNLTQIAHAFIFPQMDGSLDLSGFTFYPELIQAAHLNGVGVVISVGGYDLVRTPRFDSVAAKPASRTRFVTALKDFCLTYGYDGVDMDWEYPKSAGRSNTTLLFQELRTALSSVSPALSLSIAAPATDWNNGYDWTVMKNILDWVGVMTYDFYGSWTTKVGPNSPLYGNLSQTDQGWVGNSVSFYRTKGVPDSKLLIGTPFYGWQFNGSTMYGPGVGTAQKAYSSITPLMQTGWSRSWDAVGHVPYLTNPTQSIIISYDDSVSIGEKMTYVKNQGLGGTIIWALGQDYFSTGQQPLLRSVAAGLGLISDVKELVSGSLPKTLELQQNYPNPFNPTTAISYQLPAPSGAEGSAVSSVSLKVYDLLGREIAVLAEGPQNPGTYTVRFDASTLPSGVYIYRLTDGTRSMMRTMIVLR
ncbi:MAG: glycosyl hydrolase family 18 protein [Ignavibacteriales bacterium]|nr:glycosyl hydrolase family 18 protein [Ignavibacteriales bacterium]